MLFSPTVEWSKISIPSYVGRLLRFLSFDSGMQDKQRRPGGLCPQRESSDAVHWERGRPRPRTEWGVNGEMGRSGYVNDKVYFVGVHCHPNRNRYRDRNRSPQIRRLRVLPSRHSLLTSAGSEIISKKPCKFRLWI